MICDKIEMRKITSPPGSIKAIAEALGVQPRDISELEIKKDGSTGA
jgi:plasmid maintenance system antidote protein VapI